MVESAENASMEMNWTGRSGRERELYMGKASERHLILAYLE